MNALNAGKITPTQFIDLNRKIGGTDIDDNFISSRSVADPGSLTTIYTSGQANDGRDLKGVPIISLQDWSETHEIHTSFHSWEMRARLDRDTAITTTRSSGPTRLGVRSSAWPRMRS